MLVDEAYIDFGDETAIGLVDQPPDLASPPSNSQSNKAQCHCRRSHDSKTPRKSAQDRMMLFP